LKAEPAVAMTVARAATAVMAIQTIFRQVRRRNLGKENLIGDGI